MDVKTLEQVQHVFTHWFVQLRHMGCKLRLNMYSLQRRKERGNLTHALKSVKELAEMG